MGARNVAVATTRSVAISKDLLDRLFSKVAFGDVSIAAGDEVYIVLLESPEQRNFHFLPPSVVVKNNLIASGHWSHGAGTGDTALGSIVQSGILNVYDSITDVTTWLLQIANHGLSTIVASYEVYHVKGL